MSAGLKSRLRRLTGSRTDGDKRAEAQRAEPGWEAIGACEEHTEFGAFIRRQTHYPAPTRHGRYTLDKLRNCAEALTPLCTNRPGEPIHSERLLFFDAETTGLGVGAGNVPFMIGMGYFTPTAFVVDQMLIRNPAEERAMLEFLWEKMKERDVLVTYNGRAFDWPVVKNRQVLNRIAVDDAQTDPLHLDLLFAARSLWKHTLESCRLSTVERERLGVRRTDDVPGSLAPSLYFHFLQEQDPLILRGVFEHNERDVLSLAALAVCLTQFLSGEFESERFSAEELFRLGMWLDRLGEDETAEKVFSQLVERDEASMERYWHPLSLKYKREGNWERALALWQRSSSVPALVELAKYYEHRQKDPQTALQYALEAKARWSARPVLQGQRERYREMMRELDHRIARLRRKSEPIFAEQRPGHGWVPGTEWTEMHHAREPVTLFNWWKEEGAH